MANKAKRLACLRGYGKLYILMGIRWGDPAHPDASPEGPKWHLNLTRRGIETELMWRSGRDGAGPERAGHAWRHFLKHGVMDECTFVPADRGGERFDQALLGSNAGGRSAPAALLTRENGAGAAEAERRVGTTTWDRLTADGHGDARWRRAVRPTLTHNAVRQEVPVSCALLPGGGDVPRVPGDNDSSAR